MMDSRIEDLHRLPKIRDSFSYLYVEHAKVDRLNSSIAVYEADGSNMPVPASSLCLLMLGPGTRITQSAVTTLADNNCLVAWCGEEGVRFYAYGGGGTRSSASLIHQARLCSDPDLRLEVVRQMYRIRFGDNVDPTLSVEQLRGMEGVRVRDTYAKMSRDTGLEWTGRNYDRSSWNNTTPVNKALSCANSCLYGLCHAAIVAAGYSPGLGFIHWGKQLSFVYDIADLYKCELTIPLAFELAAAGTPNLERAVRHRCRDIFRDHKLLQRIIPDIQKCLSTPLAIQEEVSPLDDDPALPTDLWTPAPEVEARAADAQWGNE
jgi:CRISPR-associated protein Cas1